MEGRCGRWLNAPSPLGRSGEDEGWDDEWPMSDVRIMWCERSVTSAKTIADFLAPLPPLSAVLPKTCFFYAVARFFFPPDTCPRY